MIYLVKNIEENNTPQRINLIDYIETFSFVPFLHPDSRPIFQEKVKDYIPNVSDVAAAVATKIFTHRPNDKMILEAMNCCESILHSNNYESLYERELQQMAASAGDDTALVVAVLGCQIRDLLKSRVDAAISLLGLLQHDTKLFFSGAAPGRSSRIPNESKSMYNYYQSQQKKFYRNMRKGIFAHSVYLENSSQSTKQNIKNILVEMNKHVLADKVYLFIVSSNFHLVRVDFELSGFVSQKEFEKIDKIFLCGSEDIYRLSGVSKNGRYIKQLFFGIFNDLMKKESFYQFPSEH